MMRNNVPGGLSEYHPVSLEFRDSAESGEEKLWMKRPVSEVKGERFRSNQAEVAEGEGKLK
jgi:hypothetical protein